MNLRQAFLMLAFLVNPKGLGSPRILCKFELLAEMFSVRNRLSTRHLFVEQDVSDLVVLHAALVLGQWCALAR
jgi:hypothetical protein